jgi:signal transduction histidine kinase/ligand-binding sensor domain-containing protein/AraC-like DNA-binding protein
LSLHHSAVAQRIGNLGVDRGLSGIQTFSAVQDKNGFVWISTRFGIDRYDGRNIKNYPLDILTDRRIIRRTNILLDRDSALWVYTDRGTIYRYDENRDVFKYYYFIDSYLQTAHFDASNCLWIGARSYFGRIVNDTLDIIRVPLPNGESVKAIDDYDENRLLAVSNRNVYLYNMQTRSISPLAGLNELQHGEILIESAFYEKSKNRIWIGCMDGRLFVYETANRKLEQADAPQLLHHPILTIKSRNDTCLLVGTDGFGLCMMHKDRRTITKAYNNHADKAAFINGDGVYGILQDSDGRIWIATYSSGVYVLDFSGQNFHAIRHGDGLNASPAAAVCDILQDAAGRYLWIATNNGLNRLDLKSSTWKMLFPAGNILSLCEDSRGHIWAGTYSFGMYRLNSEGDVLAGYTNPHNAFHERIGTNFVYAICEDSEGNIWSGGKKGRTSKLDIATNTFTQVQSVAQVNCIISANDSTMLAANESGVFLIDIHSMKSTPCLFNKNLRSRYVSDIYIESDSILWLGTYGDGLNRCNMLTGSVASFTQSDGLASDIIYAILDSGADLWLSSENGVIKFNMKEKAVVNFSVGEDIAGNKFRQLSKEKSANFLYFGSHNGVYFFNPAQVKTESKKPRIFLQDFYLFNRRVMPAEKSSPLSRPLNRTDEIRLSHSQHSFAISFTAVDFVQNRNCRFTWKLEGLDEDWIAPTQETTAGYTNLKHGEYVFCTRYINAENEVLDQRQIRIVIAPPFRNTVYARIILAVLLMAVACSIYIYVKSRIGKRQSEEKIKFFINTAHDIRTPLTLISGPIDELKESLEPAGRTAYLFDLVTSNLDTLNSMFSHLLDFEKAHEQKDKLIAGRQNVNEFLSEAVDAWHLAAAKKKISLLLEMPDTELVEWFDMEKMRKTVNNLLSNAVKYTPDGGAISVKLASDDRYWTVTVSDTGIGIPKKDMDSLFTRFYRAENSVNSQIAGSGLGLLLVKKYMLLHRASIRVSSSLQKGTTFYLQFLHGKEHYRADSVIDRQPLPASPDWAAGAEPRGAGKPRIKLLIVDDNHDLRTFMKTSLARYYRVEVAENGLEAWNIIAQFNPDVIVSDIQMPEMNGLEFCMKVKGTFETSHIPVILLTVADDDESMERGLGLGADDYITKPVDIKFLRMKIDSMIQNRKAMQRKFLGMDSVPSDEQLKNEYNARFIGKVTEIINSNLTNPHFSIANFAREIGLSRSRLYSRFNAIVGCSPHRYIKIARMNKAIRYLGEKKYPISEVVLMSGFEDQAYFSNCFKEIYGISPTQFIESGMSGPEDLKDLKI